MTSLNTLLFALLLLMVLVWFVCVRNLSHLLRDRHAEKYDQMGLADLWPRDAAGWLSGFNNAGPVYALLRFLLRGEDRALHDADVSRLAAFMRWFFFAYLALFFALLLPIPSGEHRPRANPRHDAVPTATGIEQRRERLFVPYRAKQWAQAIAAYDALRPESEQDAPLTYWRGMAYWQLGEADRALQDFRRAIELDPDNFEAHRGADRILSAQQRWEEILEMWDRYIERTPASAEAYFERGGTHFHKGDLAAAQADAAKSCELGKREACVQAERLKAKL